MIPTSTCCVRREGVIDCLRGAGVSVSCEPMRSGKFRDMAGNRITAQGSVVLLPRAVRE
jgi:hypothetical protein